MTCYRRRDRRELPFPFGSGSVYTPLMQELTSIEAAAVEHCGDAPMLDQVVAWSAINSGSRNLDGLDRMARTLAEAFSPLPGPLDLRNPSPVEAMAPDGTLSPVAHGANLHLRVRPEA